MKRDVVLRPRALQDLREIWRYSASRWSPAQADSYVRGVRVTLDSLRQGPISAVSADWLHDGLRRVKFRSHLIFFLVDETQIDVVCILHEQMDIPSRLRFDLRKE